MKKLITVAIALLLMLGLVLSALPVYADEGDGSTDPGSTVVVGQADGTDGTTVEEPAPPDGAVQTDKADYAPIEIPIITGGGFIANTEVTVTVIAPDGTITTFTAITDDLGQFVTTYTGPMGDGTFDVSVTDGVVTGTTTFTDWGYYPPPPPPTYYNYVLVTGVQSSDSGGVPDDTFTTGEEVWAKITTTTYTTTTPPGDSPNNVSVYVTGDNVWFWPAYLPPLDVSGGVETPALTGDWLGKIATAGSLGTGTYDIVVDVNQDGYAWYGDSVDALGWVWIDGVGWSTAGFIVTGPSTYTLVVNANLPAGATVWGSDPAVPPITGGEGTYPAGSTPTASMNAFVFWDTLHTSAYVFDGWGGDASGLGLTSDPITMNADKTADATWENWYYLTVESPYGTPILGGDVGWYPEDYPDARATLDIGQFGDYEFAYWAFDASGGDYTQSDPITMTEPKTATAVWALIQRAAGMGIPTGVAFTWFGNPVFIPIDGLGQTIGEVIIRGLNPDDPMLILAPGTQVLGPGGVIQLSVEGKPAGTPAAPAGTTMIHAYQFLPSGTHFNPAAKVVINYDPADVPAGSVLVIAYYDEAAGQWVEVETAGYVLGGEEVPNAVTCDITHFTYFALLAK